MFLPTEYRRDVDSHSVSAATQAVFRYVQTAVVSSGMLLSVLASTSFNNVKGIIVSIPDEVIFIVFKKRNGLNTLGRRTFWRSSGTLLRARMWKITRRRLRLNIDSRCTNEPVFLCKISAIVNARIFHIYLLPFLFYWCKVALLQGWTSFPQSVAGNFRCYTIADRRKLINVCSFSKYIFYFTYVVWGISSILKRVILQF